MMRLNKLKWIGFVALVFGTGVCSLAKQPNIIYINTDDLGIGKVNCYGLDNVSSEIIKMPNLDRLRAEGMQFSNAYAGSAVCGPSRCSLLTGKHPGHAVWRGNSKKPPVQPWMPDYPLLGQVARDAGYTTAAFGKISAGGTDTPENITAYGWDYWLGFLGHIDCRDYYAAHIWENGRKIKLPKNNSKDLAGTKLSKKAVAPEGLVPKGKGTFIEDLYTDKLIEFITKNKDKPFMVYFASTVPHGGAPGGMRVPDMEGYDQLTQLNRREQVYCALITRHDKNIGRIRAAVEELGLAENTIILWTSDNGDCNSYYQTEQFDGNGPFRDKKRSLYEGGIRVPLVAWWPGKIKPGSTTDLQTTQWDLMPTVAEAGGAPITAEMDGISILPTLSGKPEEQTNRKYIYWEYETQQAVRMGDWKAYRKGGPTKPIELFRLYQDVGEENDVAAGHPELVEQFVKIMAKEHTPHPQSKYDGISSGKNKGKKK